MQHSYEVNDGTGAEVRASINEALKALSTISAGDIAPEVTYPYMLWFDTANKILMQRSANNDDWAELQLGANTDYVDAAIKAFKSLCLQKSENLAGIEDADKARENIGAASQNSVDEAVSAAQTASSLATSALSAAQSATTSAQNAVTGINGISTRVDEVVQRVDGIESSAITENDVLALIAANSGSAGDGGISLSDVFTSDDWLAIEGSFEDLSSRMGDISTALAEIIGEAI